MTALTANVTASDVELPTDTADPEPGSLWTLGDEVIEVGGSASAGTDEFGRRLPGVGFGKTRWIVQRAIAGTTAASHLSGATLTRYYPDAPSSGDGGSVELAVMAASVTLTDAQVKALPTTPITLVAPVDAGQAIVPLQWISVADTAGGDYTNIDAAALMYPASAVDGSPTVITGYDETGGSGGSSVPLVSQVLASGTTDTPFMFQSAERFMGFGVEVVDGAGLYLFFDNASAGNLTGGNAGNSLKVTVLYTVVDVS